MNRPPDLDDGPSPTFTTTPTGMPLLDSLLGGGFISGHLNILSFPSPDTRAVLLDVAKKILTQPTSLVLLQDRMLVEVQEPWEGPMLLVVAPYVGEREGDVRWVQRETLVLEKVTPALDAARRRGKPLTLVLLATSLGTAAKFRAKLYAEAFVSGSKLGFQVRKREGLALHGATSAPFGV